jgi:type IV secretory pathway VirB10-like protein
VKLNRSVVIPKGSRLVGHVTEVKARSKDQATSVVGIAFDRAVLNKWY